MGVRNENMNLAVVKTDKLETTLTTNEIEQDFAISAKTSIFRKVASAPLRQLAERGLITGSVLNFGKGKYSTDTDYIRTQDGVGLVSEYDYTYCRTDILGKSFSTVFAGFVLNTLPPASRKVVWQQIANATSRNHGIAYIAVRSDKGIKGTPKADGFVSSVGTFQKRYCKGDLFNESIGFFQYAEEIKGKSGYRLIRCSHQPLLQL